MSLLDRYRARHAKPPSLPEPDLAHLYRGTLSEHKVTQNRAGKTVFPDADQAAAESYAGQAPMQHFVTGQDGQPVSIPNSEPSGGLWNHGVRGESVTSGAIRVTDPEAAREELIARATERAQRTQRQRESVQKARAQGYELGLEQGLELGRRREQDEARRAENAEWDREQDKALKVLRHPPFQAMVKHHGPATVVQICTTGNDGVRNDQLMMSTGISVCAPCDVYDRTVGTQIAYARAMRLMADMLEEGAASRTRHVKERY